MKEEQHYYCSSRHCVCLLGELSEGVNFDGIFSLGVKQLVHHLFSEKGLVEELRLWLVLEKVASMEELYLG